jgi:hypothetical protein
MRMKRKVMAMRKRKGQSRRMVSVCHFITSSMDVLTFSQEMDVDKDKEDGDGQEQEMEEKEPEEEEEEEEDQLGERTSFMSLTLTD